MYESLTFIRKKGIKKIKKAGVKVDNKVTLIVLGGWGEIY